MHSVVCGLEAHLSLLGRGDLPPRYSSRDGVLDHTTTTSPSPSLPPLPPCPRSYLLAYNSHHLKDTFNVHSLDLKAVARSFGFSAPPRVNINIESKAAHTRKAQKGGQGADYRRMKTGARHGGVGRAAGCRWGGWLK